MTDQTIYAEGVQGTKMTFTPLLATPAGTKAMQPLTWSFCIAPKPLAENNAVAGACVSGVDSDGKSALVTIAVDAPSTDGTLPNDGCMRFGPQAPPSTGGAPLRARDPDSTGGYYQPVRATWVFGAPDGGDLTAFGLVRIRCDLANASADVVRTFNDAYKKNRNPTLDALAGAVSGGALQPLVAEGDASPPAGALAAVPAGAQVSLRATWKPDASETWPYFDPARSDLVMRGESLRVSWFATGGSFDLDTGGRGEAELWDGTGGGPQSPPARHLDGATGAPLDFVENRWTAPSASGPVWLWVVLRDERGGTDFRAYTLSVQ
jgi:hypothetical protein